jgi:hypothetical protein
LEYDSSHGNHVFVVTIFACFIIGSLNPGSTLAAEIEKLLQIEKWRPFFFDMFNRVGNMTILSLRKEINQIIEEYCT